MSIKNELANRNIRADAILKKCHYAIGIADQNGKNDDFYRPFQKDAKAEGTPPFYSMRLWPKTHHTMGGVQINTPTTTLSICSTAPSRPFIRLVRSPALSAGRFIQAVMPPVTVWSLDA
ncbi:MAG: hypothetical protein ACOWYE_02990 [Desulfatiglandales bacterium]